MAWLCKRWLWLMPVFIGIAGWLAYLFWGQEAVHPDYRTAKIEKGTITASVTASGTLHPVRAVQVGSQVSGQLKEVLADFNSPVKRGQVIARIDPQTFEHRLRQAQADLDAAYAQFAMQQAAIAAQRAQLAQAEVSLAEAGRVLERKQDLLHKGFISAAERDTAQAAYNGHLEQVKAGKAQVAVAEANAANAAAVVKQRQAVLAQAQVDLERTAIRAPLDGIVIKRSVATGQTVAASLQAPELFVIAENLADMRVEVAIDEAEIGRIRPGQKASFTVDAFPGRRFAGEVAQIRMSPQALANVVTYTVEVSAKNPDLALLPGMTANVHIVTDIRSDVLKVPSAALRFKPPKAGSVQRIATGSGGKNDRQGPRGRIYMLDENQQPRELEVQLGLTDGAHIEVLSSDIREGMEVITGISQLSGTSTRASHSRRF